MPGNSSEAGKIANLYTIPSDEDVMGTGCGCALWVSSIKSPAPTLTNSFFSRNPMGRLHFKYALPVPASHSEMIHLPGKRTSLTMSALSNSF